MINKSNNRFHNLLLYQIVDPQPENILLATDDLETLIKVLYLMYLNFFLFFSTNTGYF